MMMPTHTGFTGTSYQVYSCDHGDKLTTCHDLRHCLVLMREELDRGVYNDEILTLKSHPLDIKHIPELESNPEPYTQPITSDVNMVDDDSHCSCPSLVNSSSDESSVGNEDLFGNAGLPQVFATDCDGKFMTMTSEGKLEQRVRHAAEDYEHITAHDLKNIKTHSFFEGGFFRFHTKKPSFASRAEAHDGSYKTVHVRLQVPPRRARRHG